MMFQRQSRVILAVALVTAGLTLSFPAAAQAGQSGGSRTCTAPKTVALYSDQVGPGYHYYVVPGTVWTTQQPAGARGKFNSYSGSLSTAWSIWSSGTLYIAGSTCN